MKACIRNTVAVDHECVDQSIVLTGYEIHDMTEFLAEHGLKIEHLVETNGDSQMIRNAGS